MAHYEAFAIIAEGFAKLAMISIHPQASHRGKDNVRHVKF